MIILQDTREKTPWSFISCAECLEQNIECLSEGDYTLADYPFLVAVERKRSVNEIATNLGKKYHQFTAELERLKQYRFRYVVCEFSEEKLLIYPKSSGLPPYISRKIKMSGKFLHKRIQELIDIYEIDFLFCNNKYEAQDIAFQLISKAYNIYNEEQSNRSNNT